MVTRQELMTEIRELIDTPFLDNGFSPDGLDCVGLIMYPAHKLGLLTDEQVKMGQDEYLRIAIDARLVRRCEKYLRRVAKNKMEPCDIILFRPEGFRFATHVGWYVGSDRVIHSAEKYRRVVETHISQQLEKEIVRVYRFKEFFED